MVSLRQRRWLHFAPADVVSFPIVTLYFSYVPFKDDVPDHTVSHSMIDSCVACLYFSRLQFKAMSVLCNLERAAVLCACSVRSANAFENIFS